MAAASRRTSSARTAPPARRARTASLRSRMVFERRNYALLLGSIALIVIGYVLMAAENEIDGFLSLYVSPLLLVGGYLLAMYAVLWHPRASAPATAPAAE